MQSNVELGGELSEGTFKLAGVLFHVEQLRETIPGVKVDSEDE